MSEVIRVESKQQLQAAVNKTIEIDGVIRQAKAGSFLSFGALKIWIKDRRVETVLGTKVRLVGVLSQGISPISSFPVATRDENGEWSQGVVSSESFLQLNSFLPEMQNKQSKIKEAVGSGWLIRIETMSVLRQGGQ